MGLDLCVCVGGAVNRKKTYQRLFKWGLGIVLLPCLIYQVLDSLVPSLSFLTFYKCFL